VKASPPLSKAEVAARLGAQFNPGGRPFTVRAVTRWMRERRMPHRKLGNRVAFDAAAVDAWADRRFCRNTD